MFFYGTCRYLLDSAKNRLRGSRSSFLGVPLLLALSAFSPLALAATDAPYLVDMTVVGEQERIAFSFANGASDAQVFDMQQQRGVIQTGLYPVFSDNADCRAIDSETWAKDYTRKRGKPAHHKGIDIPAPEGEPILAVADGTLIAVFENRSNPKGIEVVLRHAPEDSNLPFWTYSQYTHLLALPDLALGARVTVGSEIGKTSNTGLSGKAVRQRNTGSSGGSKHSRSKVRRPALHFAIFYTEDPGYAIEAHGVIPVNGRYMDPNAFYREQGPYDSQSMQRLPDADKAVAVPYLDQDGHLIPSGSRRIWPYRCQRY